MRRLCELPAKYGPVAIYFCVWLFTGKALAHDIPGLYPWAAGGLPGLLYSAGQLYEIRYRGHCYLSADPTALGGAMAGQLVIYIIGLLWYGHEAGLLLMARIFVTSFFFAHIAALAFGFLSALLLPQKWGG